MHEVTLYIIVNKLGSIPKLTHKDEANTSYIESIPKLTHKDEVNTLYMYS